MREISGDFAIETKIAPIYEEVPTAGGLLIWKDEDNIRFERGMDGEHEISLSGRAESKGDYFGSGLITFGC